MSAMAIAVAIAVLAGALVVGWSLQTSLERELMSRTGGMTYAVSPRMALDGQQLVANLRETGLSVGGVLQLPAAGMSDSDSVRTAVLTVWGVGAASPLGWPSEKEIGRDEVILNSAAAADLSARPGDWVVIRADISSTRPASGLFHYRDPSELSRTLRLRVRGISAEAYAGFSLAASQARPRNAFVRADVLFPGEQAGRANTLLASATLSLDQINSAIRSSVSLPDLGITTTRAGGRTYLHSKAIAFPEPVAALLMRETQGRPLATHIAQRISSGDRHVSYGVIVASVGGCGPGEIGLNAWVAQDLGVKLGDEVVLSALVAGPAGSYIARDVRLKAVAIDPPGLGYFAPQVTPGLQGMTSAERMDDWKAPFPVDMGLVTPRDEEYWRDYRAAPKAIISMDLMVQLWAESGFIGELPVTTIVIDGALAEATARTLAASVAELDPGWAAIDVQQSARRASKGSTDFAGLFAAMSAFVVIASLLVAIGVVRTGLEARVGGLGLASALGVAGRSWRWAMLAEEAIICIPAIAAGVVLGVLYGRGLLWLFVTLGGGTWELPEVVLDVRPVVLAVWGVVVSLVVLGAARWQIRHLLRQSARELLWGMSESAAPGTRPTWRTALILVVLLSGAAGGVLLARRAMLDPAAGFFASAVCLMVAGWLLLRAWSMLGRRGADRLSILGLAIRFLMDSPRRVRLTYIMFCAASFVISSVALFRSGEPAVDPQDRTGATGGFALRLTSPVAYRSDLSSEAGRETLGIARTLPDGIRVHSLLASRGVEGGCLNLASPEEMQVLGVGEEWVKRGAFEVRTAGTTEKPWTQLGAPVSGEDAIPVFGDEETMQWIAYRKVGDVFTMPIEGKRTALRLAGVIRGGLFSGQLIMSEANLRRLAPSAGYAVHFVETRRGEEPQARGLLAGLFDYGFRVDDTSQVINGVRSVQRLYMTMFVALGALGLVLGAAGSAAVLVRDAAVRRGGLAMLQAVGLSRRLGAGVLVVSHLTPVMLGLIVGMISAAIAYMAFGRPTTLSQPLLIAAAVAFLATVVIVVLAHVLQPRSLVESLRTV